MKDANEAPHSYLNIVESNEDREINHDKMKDYQLWNLQQKCQVLSLALSITREKMVPVQSWDSCCKEAIQQSNWMGITSATNSRIIWNWYQEFQVKWNSEWPVCTIENTIFHLSCTKTKISASQYNNLDVNIYMNLHSSWCANTFMMWSCQRW